MTEKREFVIEIEYDKYHINFLRKLWELDKNTDAKNEILKRGYDLEDKIDS